MDEPRRRTVQVLDTTALLAGLLEHGPASLVTVKDIIEEVRYGGIAPERLMTAVDSGLLEVKTPNPIYISKVRETAEKSGDLPGLSNADINLIAVALEEHERGYDVTLVSDDYSIQNTAIQLGLKVLGSIHPTIRRPLKWFFICAGCGFEASSSTLVCPRCGSTVVKTARRQGSGY